MEQRNQLTALQEIAPFLAKFISSRFVFVLKEILGQIYILYLFFLHFGDI
jgi:hypothetical protein